MFQVVRKAKSAMVSSSVDLNSRFDLDLIDLFSTYLTIGFSDGQSRPVPSTLRSAALRKPPSKLKSGLLKLQQRRLDSRGRALRPTSVAVVNAKKKGNSPKSSLPDESVFDKTLLRSTPQIEFRIKDSALKDVIEGGIIPANHSAGFGVFSAGDSTTVESLSIS